MEIILLQIKPFRKDIYFVVTKLGNFAEENKYSSAKFYLGGMDEFDIVTDYSGN